MTKHFFFNIFFFVEKHDYRIFKKKEENTFKKKKTQRGKNIDFEENIFFIPFFGFWEKRGNILF